MYQLNGSLDDPTRSNPLARANTEHRLEATVPLSIAHNCTGHSHGLLGKR